jgi:hypothetical protein
VNALSLWERAGVRAAYEPIRSPHPRFARLYPLPQGEAILLQLRMMLTGIAG